MPAAVRAIPGFPDYYASSSGQIWSAKDPSGHNKGLARKRQRGKIQRHLLKPLGDDYPRVKLFSAEYPQGKKKFIHRLVCEAWHGSPPSNEHMALHKDGNHHNISATNLYWGTVQDNSEDTVKHEKERKIKRPNHLLTESQALAIRERLMAGDAFTAVAVLFQVSLRTIYNLADFKVWKSRGIPDGFVEWRAEQKRAG
jgi:hypothetical protein